MFRIKLGTNKILSTSWLTDQHLFESECIVLLSTSVSNICHSCWGCHLTDKAWLALTSGLAVMFSCISLTRNKNNTHSLQKKQSIFIFLRRCCTFNSSANQGTGRVYKSQPSQQVIRIHYISTQLIFSQRWIHTHSHLVHTIIQVLGGHPRREDIMIKKQQLTFTGY